MRVLLLIVISLLFTVCANSQNADSVAIHKLYIAKVIKPKRTHSFKEGELIKIRLVSTPDSFEVVSSDIVYTGTLKSVLDNSIILTLNEETKTITYKDFTERNTSNVYKSDPVLFPLQKPPVKEIKFTEIKNIGKERNLNRAASMVGIYAFIGGLVTAPIYATNFNTGKMNARAYYTWLGGAMALSAVSFTVSFTLGVKKYHINDSPEINKRKKWMFIKKQT